jgi:hypothetical protein
MEDELLILLVSLSDSAICSFNPIIAVADDNVVRYLHYSMEVSIK